MRERTRSRFLSGLATLPAAVVVSTACIGEQRPQPSATALVPWSGPSAPHLRLVELEGAVSGDALPPDTGVIARVPGPGFSDSTELDREQRARQVFTMSSTPPASAGLRSARITLRPGHATEVVIEPLVYRDRTGDFQTVLEKVFRTIRVPIPPDADPDRALSFSIPLRDAAAGNWHDAAFPCRLTGLRITVSGLQTTDARIEELVFLGEETVLAGRPAAAVPVEIGGIVRPAWMVAAGARVELVADVPKGDPQLRWYDAAIGDAGPRTVRVTAGGVHTEVRESQSSGSWQARSLALDSWAGQRVSITLATAPSPRSGATVAEPGIGVFGAPEVAPSSAPRTSPDVLVYLVDALRADRLGALGHGAAQTPNLDRLAREGATFSRAMSSSCWTKPAVVTLMTGIHPTTHGVGTGSTLEPLPAGVPVLQQRFATAGWRTASFSANPLASNLTKLERGFDATYLPRFWEGRIGAFLHPTARQLHESLLDWIAEAPERPFFAYVHTLEVHQNAMPSNVADATDTRPAYDRAVSRADAMLGELLEALEARGRLDDLVLVFVSDHGESLGEHGIFGHGQSLYQPEIHVPLILWSPARIPATRHEAPVALADVAPTLLELSGLAPLDDAQGSSLVATLRGEASPRHRFVPSSHQGFTFFPDIQEQHSLVYADGRKILKVDGLGWFTFDLRRDPGEDAPGAAADGRLTELEAWLAGQRACRGAFDLQYGAAAPEPVVDADDLERLRSLGYLE